MGLEENKTLGRRFLRDIWSEGKLEVADEILAPDFVMYLSVDPFHVDGPEGLKKLVVRNRTAFQNLSYVPEDENIVAEGDRVIVPWSMTAKHVGFWAGAAPSNKEVAIHGMSFFRARDGKLTECRVQNESLSLSRQVGLLPPIGAPEYKATEANKEVVREYIDALLIRGDFSHAKNFVVDGFSIDRSAVPDAIAGPEGLHKQMDMLKAAFPDLQLRIADLFAEGDKVAVRFEAPGTQTGSFAGISPTGRSVTWKGIVIYKVQDGKVAHAWADWDDVGLLQALK